MTGVAMAGGQTLLGSCLCRAVRFVARGPPMQVTHCHCSVCRRASGAAFITYASFPLMRTYFTHWSQLRSFDLVHFCRGCGSTVGMQYPEHHGWSEPNTIWLSASLLGPLRPSAHKTEDHVSAAPQTVIGSAGACSEIPSAESGLSFGPGYPSFGPPVHIFTDSRAHWVELAEAEAHVRPLVRCAGAAGEWSEVDGDESAGPQRDLGSVEPVGSADQSYALRGIAPEPVDRNGSLKVHCCDAPAWVDADLLLAD